MGKSAQSLLCAGMEGFKVDAECTVTNGLPSIVIVGLGGKAVEEAKERIRNAFVGSKLDFPKRRITVNLAPADIPKEGSSLDLAIATAILASNYKLPEILSTDAFIGELGLDGTIRPVRGIIGKILVGKKLGITRFFIPELNLSQASLIPGITLIPLKDLKQLFDYLSDPKIVATQKTSPMVSRKFGDRARPIRKISEITGQEQAKRAIEIAAAGGHNILLSGPPGTGKTLLAQALISLLPNLTSDEVLEVTHLHSLQSNNYDELITERPFRAPHHSASHTAIMGGGHNLRPGEISLSHRGVLFFDEFPEFNRLAIEGLRQPLEEKQITVSRIKSTAVFPADFIFVATANPCPCGYYGTDKACRCSASQISRYRSKLSGPIVDRIDLFVTVDKIEYAKLLVPIDDEKAVDSNEKLRIKINGARSKQSARLKSKTRLNAHMTNSELVKTADLNPSSKEILNQASKTLGLSARGYMKVIKVARTIADLEGSTSIDLPHLTEALQYRNPSVELS